MLIILILILIIFILMLIILLIISILILIIFVLILIAILIILILILIISILIILILIILILAPTWLSVAILLPSSIRSLRVCFVVVRRSDQPRSSCRLAKQGEWTLDMTVVLLAIDHENILRSSLPEMMLAELNVQGFQSMNLISYF